MGHLALSCVRVCVCVLRVCIYVRVRLFLSLFRRETGWVTAAIKSSAAPVRKTGFFFLYLDETAAEALVFVYFGRFTCAQLGASAAKSARPSSICRLFRKFSTRSFLSPPIRPLRNFLDFLVLLGERSPLKEGVGTIRRGDAPWISRNYVASRDTIKTNAM